MERKYLDEEFVLAVVKATALRREYENAKNDMELLESALVNSLDEKQRMIYKAFCERREDFFETAYKFFHENDCPKIRLD